MWMNGNERHICPPLLIWLMSDALGKTLHWTGYSRPLSRYGLDDGMGVFSSYASRFRRPINGTQNDTSILSLGQEPKISTVCSISATRVKRQVNRNIPTAELPPLVYLNTTRLSYLPPASGSTVVFKRGVFAIPYHLVKFVPALVGGGACMAQVPRYFGFSAASTSFFSDLDRDVNVGFLLRFNTLFFYSLFFGHCDLLWLHYVVLVFQHIHQMEGKNRGLSQNQSKNAVSQPLVHSSE